MPSFQITVSPSRRAAARFIAAVRRAIQQALLEEYKARGLTQSEIARILKVHRSVINREIRGDRDLTLGRVGELAFVLGRKASISFNTIAQTAGNRYPSEASSTSLDAGQLQISGGALIRPDVTNAGRSYTRQIAIAA